MISHAWCHHSVGCQSSSARVALELRDTVPSTVVCYHEVPVVLLFLLFELNINVVRLHLQYHSICADMLLCAGVVGMLSLFENYGNIAVGSFMKVRPHWLRSPLFHCIFHGIVPSLFHVCCLSADAPIPSLGGML